MATAVPSRPRYQPPAPEPLSRRERSHSYLQRRFHASTIGRHHQHRHRASNPLQSAVELPKISNGFEHVLRRENKSGDNSRRDSGSQQQRNSEEWRVHKPVETDEELRIRVSRLKAENVRREELLRRRLKGVEEVGISAIQQLDETYYAILDKGSILRSMVLQLRALAEASRKSYCAFVEETGQVKHDTIELLDSFDQFRGQETAINTLMTKLKASKEETGRLHERLETARSRVQVYEERQSAAENTRRKQWQATLGTLLGMLVVIAAILFLKHHEHVADQLDGVGHSLVKLGDAVESVASIAVENIHLRPTAVEEDPYLRRLFEGLLALIALSLSVDLFERTLDGSCSRSLFIECTLRFVLEG